MRLIAGANQKSGGSRGMTLIGKKTEGDQQSELDRIIEQDRQDQEKRRQERDQQAASEQERRANESTVDRVLNKATDYAVSGFNAVSKVVKGGMDAYNAISDVASRVAEAHPTVAKVAGEVLTKIPGVGEAFGAQSQTKKAKDAYEKGLQVAEEKGLIDEKTRQWLSDPVLTALNTETGAKVTGTVAKSTSNLPLKGIAAVKAIGDNTYDEALSALIEGRNDPTNQRWQKLLYDVQDSGAQSAIGVLVSVGTAFLTRSPKAGQTVGMAYYGALSAESQRQEKGSVTSKKNIAVDTIGDIALGGLVESALKGIIKDSAKRTVGNVVAQTTKGFAVEGSTEVGQTLIKYANDYNDADGEEAKSQVVADVKNYVVSGGLVNELLVGGISGGIITGVTTGAGVAATGKDIEPSLQPKKGEEKAPIPAPQIQGKSTLSVEADISKLRDQLGALQAAAQNETDGSAAVEQYASVRDALSDYEIAFKERPVYIADGSQDSPLLEIETVAYPDGKVAYQFSTDTGGTSFTSTFDPQNMLGSKEEAVKAASEAVKAWVESELANASDEAEAIKLQRIYDEADALLSGKAKFEQVIPAVNVREKAESSQEIAKSQPQFTGEQIAEEAVALGSDQGGLSDYTADQIRKEDYGQQTVSIEDLRNGDADLNEYLSSGEVREFEGEPNAMDPIVSSSGEVLDGYNRIAQSLADGKQEVSVLKGIPKEAGEQPVDKKEEPKTEEPKKEDEKPEKPSYPTGENGQQGGEQDVDKTVTKKEEEPESVEAPKEKAQPKEKTEVQNDTELEAPKKSVKPAKSAPRFAKKTTAPEVKNVDVGEKIGGAHKDRYEASKDSIMKEYSASEIADLAREKAIPAVDYQALVENGTSEEALGAYTFFVATLGKKIRTSRSKFSRWIQAVQALRTFAQGMVNGNERIAQAVEELMGKDLSIAESLAMYRHFDFINNDAIRPYAVLIRSWRYAKDGPTGDLHHDYTLVQNGQSVRGVQGKTQAEFFAKVAEHLSIDKKDRGKANIADSIGVFLVSAARTPVVAYKKNGKFIELERFKTTEEARAAKKEKIAEYAKKVEELTAFTEASFRGNENTKVGKSYRNGRDVTAEEFMQTFGFRGVEFGNWVSQAERIPRLNMAFDSFKELAAILGVPDRALSLNGELGFAFGSRGVAGALAHYEPDKVVINITKENGAGTIAHEWWHALDNYLSRKAGRSTNYVTGTLNYPREELKSEIANLMSFIKKSDVYRRSVKADGYKGKPYFTNPTELGARAFEVYVKQKMQERGTQNDFLVNVSDVEDLDQAFMGDVYPYAVGEEATALTGIMQTLVSTLQVSEEGRIFSKRKATGPTITLTGKKGTIEYARFHEEASIAEGSKSFEAFKAKMIVLYGLASGRGKADLGVGSVIRRKGQYGGVDPTLFTVREVSDSGYVVQRKGATGTFRIGNGEIAEVVKKKTTGRIFDRGNKEANAARHFKQQTGFSLEEFFINVKADAGSDGAFALGDRSTRGKDGKFTGSMPDQVTDANIEQHIDTTDAFLIVKRIQKEINPALRAVLQFKIAEQLTAGKGRSEYVTDGYFSSQQGLIAMATEMSAKDFEYVLRHEINHAAFMMLPRDKQMDIEEWYIDLSERELIELYDNQPGLVKEYKDMSVRARGWDGSEQSPITFMADETFNRYMNQRGDLRTPVQKLYDEIVRSFYRLLERINQAIFRNRNFSAKAKKIEMVGYFKDVFNPKGNGLVIPTGMLEMLRHKFIMPGTIKFEDTRSTGARFAKKTDGQPKEDTKTLRFAKIISRRRELRELKRKREAALASTEQGGQIVAEAEINRENYESPNEHVVEGILNSSYFKKEGSIKDAMGEGFLMEKGDRYVVVESSRQETYALRGYRTVIEIDSLASEAGFENGQDYLEDQMSRRKLPESADMALRRVLKDTDAIYGKAEEELAQLEKELSEAKEGKGAFFQGMRVGSSIMRKNYNEKLKILKGRKEKVRAAKDFFHLSDSDFKKIGGNRELQTMSEGEFQGFLNHIEVQAEKAILRRQAMDLLIGQIQEKQLKRYDNLRRAMKLPVLDKMTTEQIREFDAALEFSQEGDEFFTQRQLETVKNTELAGIKTVREARERLSVRLGMSVPSLGTIQVSPTLDAMRYDSALADKNPFYKMLVEETGVATLEADGRFITIEEEANRLIALARKSRSRGIIDRLVPKDSRIFQYLESSDKAGMAADMTPEELTAAEFIRRRYEEMRDYLVEREMLKQYRENYITHVRKGFLETLRDDGIVAAFRDILVQQQEDEATFNILSGDTGNILPLEKFFQFSLKRTGEIKPTENVAAAFLAYTRAFEKKRALDKLIPKLDIYTYSIEPKRTTPNGLQMDRSLKKFLNEYLNNKKGRRFDFGGKLRQGGRADIALRAVRALTTILDLGLSVPAGIASNVGEQVTNFVMLGTANYAKGTARLATFRGRRFLQKYRNFTGKNPWKELAEVSNSAGDRFMSGLFILFRDAQVRANRQFLLGSITEAEYASGEISPQRLAELQVAMGRWRVVEGAKSLMGATSFGGLVNQYRTWAVPIIRTTVKDITTLIHGIKQDGLKALNTREGGELFRSIVVAGTVVMIVKALLSSGEDREKDKTMFEKLTDKAIRDLMSTIGVFDPTFMTGEIRVLGFLGDLGTALKAILVLEEYADDAADGSYEAGDLKGVKQLKRTITPSLLKQFDGPAESEDKKEKVSKFLKEGLSPEAVADRAIAEMGIAESDEEYKSQWKALEKEAIQQKTVNENGKKVERLNKARLKTTKLRLLKEYQKDMSAEEFSTFLDTLYDGKIISKPILDEF